MKQIILALIAVTLLLAGVTDAKKKAAAKSTGTTMLAIRVVGPDGRPSHHARISLRHPRGRRRRASADAAGRATLAVRPGRIRVSAHEGRSSGATRTMVSAGKMTSVVIGLHHAAAPAVYVYERHHLGGRRRYDRWRRDHKKDAAKAKTSSKSKSAAGANKH